MNTENKCTRRFHFFRFSLAFGLALSISIDDLASAAVFLDWNPSLSELPPDEYRQQILGFDPDFWTRDLTFSSSISDVFVAAPLHPIPYQPVIEYNASHDNLSASFSFSSPGVYVSKVVFEDPDVDDVIDFFFVGAAKGSKGRSEDSRKTKIEQPFMADCIIVEQPAVETGAGAGAMAIAASVIAGEQRASTVAEAITKIKECQEEKGRPVSVELVGHGAGGVISVGAGTGASPGAELENSSASTQQFIESLNGLVTGVILKGCCIAQNVDNPGRNHLMEVLADGLNAPVFAWDQTIYWVEGGLFRSGYAGIDVHGKESSRTPIPEPSSNLGFLALGIFGVASTLKHKLKPSKSSEKETTKIE